MNLPDYVATYDAHLAELTREHGIDRAMELVVGGKFVETGLLERSVMVQYGLQPTHNVIDIGCGSGRLAYALREFLTGKFTGTDILQAALNYARTKCGRSDWEFIAHHLPSIPAPDASADFVTFFSVFTHLLDEDIYRFLREAKRVLTPNGRIVFSFLDYGCDSHWPDFLKMVDNPQTSGVLNRLITRSMAERWARSLGLRVEAIHDGSEKWINIPEPFIRDDGTRLEGTVEFGQSIAVLSVFQEDAYLNRHPDVKVAVAAGSFHSGAHHYDVCGYREGRARC
jgi:ubiquinone/menaquinone biosynthesis C-methylase UbiE